MKHPKKVLIIGSGGLSIGQAGEFDYSGSQAIKALKEEGIYTVLLNPNIATIQTSSGLADKVYLLPITKEYVTEVIKKERPDALLASFGGQIALNTAVELHRSGILEKHNVKILGTPIESVIDTEDRKRFVGRLNEIGVLSPKGYSVSTVNAALKASKSIGFPIMIRAAYALGGKGSKVVQNTAELKKAAEVALATSPQILVEEYLKGWKEIEYEVMRDKYDNCITICNMENFDPLGIHTGESIVVTPSQTLSNKEYHFLRSLSIKTIRHLGIVGECNIQFAFAPDRHEYRVIEVNARLSRSSALASKASGYPIAFIAAKLALGHALPELPNKITEETSACFEPALDYVVVKMPRWDLKKFQNVSRTVGSEMKSVGEVMAIGRNFEEALQKACRMINTGKRGVVANGINIEKLTSELTHPTDLRVFAIAQAMNRGFSVDKINRLTGIDRWFLEKIHNIVTTAALLRKKKAKITSQDILTAKKQGFSDLQISHLAKISEDTVTKRRTKARIRPVVKQIDTLAGEFPAQTNYLYLTYNASENDATEKLMTKRPKGDVIVLGGGPYSIGSSVEFDWCCVTAGQTLQKEGHGCIMINSNPETVSTDYDVFDKLYFEELTRETILEIYHKEKPHGIIVSVGGQIPNNLALKLSNDGVNIIGTKPEFIDMAENRHTFSKLLDSIGVDQPAWKELSKLADVKNFAKKVGYPVLVRPSYVLSGAAMRVATDAKQLERFLSQAGDISPDHPVVVSKFITDAKEIEMDAVARDGELVGYAISEHIENAGVHSGDATLVFPAQKLYIETIRRIKSITREIAKALHINGPFNIQYLAKDNEIKVIECNLRASRTFPFISKVLGQNIIEFATHAMLGKPVTKLDKSVFDLDHMGVKAPQFSFTRLRGADPLLGVEMMSTGEVACIDHSFHHAFLKAMAAADGALPTHIKKGLTIALSIRSEHKSDKLIEKLHELSSLGVQFCALPRTHSWLTKYKIKTTKLAVPGSNKKPAADSWLMDKKIDLVINIPEDQGSKPSTSYVDDYNLRRLTVDIGVSLITNIHCTLDYFDALVENTRSKPDILELEAYHE